MGLTEELSEALIVLNELKKKEIIQDYTIGGGHAIIHHNIEYASQDLDVFAIIVSEDSFRMLQPVYKFFRERGHKIKGAHIWIGDIPIQIFPNVSPLHNNAVGEADEVEVEGIPTKVIGVEHLIALALLPFRVTDKWRIVQLLAKANKEKLSGIIDRFGNEENQLHKRYQEVLEDS